MSERVAIVGSRDYPDLEQVGRYVRSLPDSSVVVSGMARGVDTAAENAARERGLGGIFIPAQWERFGKSAGYRRNAEIVAVADRLVAFWDGKSKGTMHSVNLAREKGIPVEVITAEARP